MNMKTVKIKLFDDRRGFTLIEVVMAIVILSIISGIAGMGFVSAINGYVLAKKNADTVQNAQILLGRISKELRSTHSIDSGTQTSLTFDSMSLATPTNLEGLPIVLSWDSVSQKLLLGTDTLADNVSSFSLGYLDKFDDVTAAASYSSASTGIIKITVSLTGADNFSSTFEERVFLSGLMAGI